MRQVLHIAVAVLFWLLVAVFWIDLAVSGEATGLALRNTAVELAALTGAVFAVTMWWIRHNVGIYNRKGPRQGRPEVSPRTDVDRLDRPVRWAMPGGAHTARAQQHLVIDAAGDVKTYRKAD